MPFKKLKDEPLTGRINIRVTEEEKTEIREQADLANVSVSEYGRRRLLGRSVVAKSDMILIKELRRLGGLMKHTHNQSKGAYSQETANVLIQIGAAIERLAK